MNKNDLNFIKVFVASNMDSILSRGCGKVIGNNFYIHRAFWELLPPRLKSEYEK